MENQELVLRSEALLNEESALSPEKEQVYISAITKLNEKNSSLEEENADLRTCLHKLKSTQQGLQIGNNTNIFLVKSPNFIVL